jgi:hypothetical protein
MAVRGFAAGLNGLEPGAWLRDVLEKLPSWPTSRLDERLPYRHQTDLPSTAISPVIAQCKFTGCLHFNREALSIEIDLNLPALRVVRVLDRVAANRGYPVKLRMDNGPEFISLTLAEWAEKHAVKLEFIQPGKPTQNAFIERFNQTYCTSIFLYFVLLPV